MKKLIDRVAFWFGYVPLSVLDAAVDALEGEKCQIKAEKLSVEFMAEQEAVRHVRAETASTRGLNQQLAAITKRLPVVTR